LRERAEGREAGRPVPFLWALDVAVRVIPLPMMFKMYLLND
jgi:hypothetical protein